ncbi:Asp23/Gls24 family envelope stress response protein [Amygdalobacter nucleatus]|uniref:Asp23/Gls24 family envelope stress response protein n=1 Tax=Amygdalobacter nucleatus TaxID=3029274 RepID=UPI0027A582F8|nr:Asp23/Gls24 family envelope stress response protein [Amygdalobacter nucleatus]WEG36610.1 Asp23/Gls24 family envelope stress response protein [Amygdalobacter nucleatus]
MELNQHTQLLNPANSNESLTEASIYSQTAGERTLSLGFIAEYAKEASLKTEGVKSLEFSLIAHFKESLGVEHAGNGVEVAYVADNQALIITVYPVIYYGFSIPDVAWQIQENVKAEVERYTDLIVEEVNVHIKDVSLSQRLL